MIAISKNKRSQIVVRVIDAPSHADVYLQLETSLQDPLVCEIEKPLEITICERED